MKIYKLLALTAFFGITNSFAQCDLDISASVTEVYCNGDSTGSITLMVTGGAAPYTYEIMNEDGELMNEDNSNTANSLPEGTYTINVADTEDCDSTLTINISAPPALVFTEFGGEHATSGSGGVVFMAASGGVPDYSYEWVSVDDPSINSSNTSWGGLDPGCYIGTVTDGFGCTLSDTVCIGYLGAEEMTELPFELYYSTASGQVVINSDNPAQLNVYTLCGQLVFKENLAAGENKVLFEANGQVYLYELLTSEGAVFSGKFGG